MCVCGIHLEQSPTFGMDKTCVKRFKHIGTLNHDIESEAPHVMNF